MNHKMALAHFALTYRVIRHVGDCILLTLIW